MMSENNTAELKLPVKVENAIQTVDDMLRNRKSKMHITDCLAISVVLKEIRRQAAREKELIEVLNNIANPIQYFQKEAEKRGAVVDDVAADSLSNDANFLKSLAKKAVEKENK